MSKFIDRLKQLAEGTPQSIGFRRSDADSRRPKIQLVAGITDQPSTNPPPSLALADAGLVWIQAKDDITDVLAKLTSSAAIPWGVRITKDGNKDSPALLKAGADFVAFPTSALLAGLLSKDIGRVLEVDSSTSDTVLRTVGVSAVDAVLVHHEKPDGTGLTWADLMAFQRIAAMVNKPVIMPVPAGTTKEEIQTLWEGGVDGVVLDVGANWDELTRLRDIIAQLEYPKVSRGEKGVAFAPRVQPEVRRNEEEDDEDE
jgi:hypothetical protein